MTHYSTFKFAIENTVSTNLLFVDMSHIIMRKPAFCICKIKDADQLSSNCTADQRLCFRYMDNTIVPLSKPLAIFCSSTAQFSRARHGSIGAK